MTVNVILLNKFFMAPDDRNRLLRTLGNLAGKEFNERSDAFVKGYTETNRGLVKRAFRPRDK